MVSGQKDRSTSNNRSGRRSTDRKVITKRRALENLVTAHASLTLLCESYSFLGMALGPALMAIDAIMTKHRVHETATAAVVGEDLELDDDPDTLEELETVVELVRAGQASLEPFEQGMLEVAVMAIEDLVEWGRGPGQLAEEENAGDTEAGTASAANISTNQGDQGLEESGQWAD